MAAKIADAERRRYEILAEQYAIHGYDTPPHIVMELNELRAKYGPIELLDQPHVEERRRHLDFDIAWLTANMAIMFRRQTKLEGAVKLGRILDIVMSLMLLVLLMLAFSGRL